MSRATPAARWSISPGRSALAAREALDRVRAQAEPKRLQRRHVAGSDVSEVALGAAALQQPHLLAMRRRVEDQPVAVDRVRDLVDQPGSRFAVRTVDACRSRLARLRDHLPRARREVAFDLFDPDVRRHDELDVLAPDLGEHREASAQPFDQLALDVGVDRDRAIRDLDVSQPELVQPRDEPVDAALADRELGQRPAEHHGDVVGRVALELRAQVRSDERGAPTELDDVDARARDLEQAVDLRDREALVDHVRQAAVARLDRTLGNVEKARYGTDDTLSWPTTTTTFAELASAEAEPSIGCTVATPRECATAVASALCPLV